jgi:serine/threonine-protein kinase
VELAQGVTVAERFRLIRPLSKGGMGAVWLAQHTGLDIPCAIKFIHEEEAQSDALRARFEREAKAAAQLRSPHVVQILDHGLWRGLPYIAMELLEGEDLAHRLRRCGTLSPRDTLAIAAQVGRALSKAHAAGLVHRDLKPGNIFLVRDEDREIAKVLDFGVAKVTQHGVDGNTKTGAVLGTPFYMSPEQARGVRAVDHRSDLWALAVVVYQCLTGQLPFRGAALGDLFVKIIVDPIPVPSHVALVPPGFDAWWARATARDPGLRFQTAREMMDNLALALAITVHAGVEVGSVMASQTAMPGRGHGMLAIQTPDPGHKSGPSAAFQNEASPARTGPANPGDTPRPPVAGAGPSGMPQAISVHQVPMSGRGGLFVGVVVLAASVGSVGAWFAFRSGPRAGAGEFHATEATATAAPSAVPVDVPGSTVTTAAPSDTTSASASAAPNAPPVPSATAAVHSHGPAHGTPGQAGGHPQTPGVVTRTPPPPPPPGGRPKTDFGF